ncbi:hypothetical protein HOK021_16590 [Streptomyces hygroscopicus]|nr:hypothetical protein HOK021_16590 [Streptomyces hygroscopicus]
MREALDALECRTNLGSPFLRLYTERPEKEYDYPGDASFTVTSGRKPREGAAGRGGDRLPAAGGRADRVATVVTQQLPVGGQQIQGRGGAARRWR